MIQVNRYKEKPPRPKSWGLGRPTNSLRCGWGGDEFDVFQENGFDARTVRRCGESDKVRVALVISVADTGVGCTHAEGGILKGFTLQFCFEV